MRRVLVLGLVSACSSPSPAPPPGGPEARTARLTGAVTDEAGAGLSGVRVAAAGRTAQTGSDGSFVLDGVPEGTQLVTASAPGRHAEVAAVRVEPPEAQVALSLASSAGSVELALAGDVAFSSRLATLPDSPAELASLYEAAAPLLESADLAIVNLETVLTAEPGAPHPSRQRLLLGPPAGAAALARLGVDVVGLANDHVYDYLDDGVLDTLDALRAAGLQPVGAGADQAAAAAPVVVERNGVQVGVLAFSALTGRGEESGQAEPPFCDATSRKAGSALLEPAGLSQAVADLRARTDRVVVLLHGGGERDEAPSPLVATQARIAIDAGADVVVAHHPRAPGGLEVYKDGLVVYGLGSFGYEDDDPAGFSGAVLRLRLPRSGPLGRAVLLPVFVDRAVPGAAAGPLARAVIDRVGERSAPLGVTVLHEGEAGRVLPLAPGTLPTVETVVGVDVPITPGEGAVQGFEDQLGPGRFLSLVELVSPAGASLWIGREVLGVGDFEDLVADGTFAAPTGWIFPSDAEQILAGDGAASGRAALSVCRSGTARTTATAETRARFPLGETATFTVCGCWRGDGGATGGARIAFFKSLDEDEGPLESRLLTEGPPPADWDCFCHAASAPDGARYASLRLEHTPTADHSACIYFDAFRMIGWALQRTDRVTLGVPNDASYVRVTGVGSASSASLSVGVTAFDEVGP